ERQTSPNLIACGNAAVATTERAMSLLKKLFGSARKTTTAAGSPTATKRRPFQPGVEELEDREVPTLMRPTVYTLRRATACVSTPGMVRTLYAAGPPDADVKPSKGEVEGTA